MKWVLFFLMICIIIPGLYYTGFIDFSKVKSVSEEESKTAVSEEKIGWSPISSPQWEAQSLSGEIFSLKELRGQIIILNFWASWCLPCRKEFPELLAAIQWAKGDISLVAVSVDSSKEDIKNFLKSLDVPGNKNGNLFFSMGSWLKQKAVKKESEYKEKQYIHIVWDPGFKIAKQFHVVRFPETFILNRDLEIVKKYTGEFFLKESKAFLGSLLPKRENKVKK